jgi:hypothetical protein
MESVVFHMNHVPVVEVLVCTCTVLLCNSDF